MFYIPKQIFNYSTTCTTRQDQIRDLPVLKIIAYTTFDNFYSSKYISFLNYKYIFYPNPENRFLKNKPIYF